MAALILSRLAFGVKKIGDGRATHHNGFFQNILQHAAKSFRLLRVHQRAQPRGMNLRPPQALIGIDISYASQDALV
jgi:hypothetical protein